jgi:hypothetical protein
LLDITESATNGLDLLLALLRVDYQ